VLLVAFMVGLGFGLLSVHLLLLNLVSGLVDLVAAVLVSAVVGLVRLVGLPGVIVHMVFSIERHIVVPSEVVIAIVDVFRLNWPLRIPMFVFVVGSKLWIVIWIVFVGILVG